MKKNRKPAGLPSLWPDLLTSPWEIPLTHLAVQFLKLELRKHRNKRRLAAIRQESAALESQQRELEANTEALLEIVGQRGELEPPILKTKTPR